MTQRFEDKWLDLSRYAGTYGGYTKAEPGWRWGALFQGGGLWIGAHYSRHNRRWCINLLPCLTVWVALPGGKAP